MGRMMGEAHPLHKLTEEDVRVIRALCEEDKFSYAQIAEFFNISKDYVGIVYRGKTWKHISNNKEASE